MDNDKLILILNFIIPVLKMELLIRFDTHGIISLSDLTFPLSDSK